VLHSLYANKDAWTVVEAARQPRSRGIAPRADLGIAFATPNFAPEVA
jgi:UDP-3-O-[3-hydroxymyristoyl] N-acetylglucosamine deacetylase